MITKEMTVLDVVERHTGTIEVFKAYDNRFNVCICCQSLFESLENVCEKYGIDLDNLLAEINAAVFEELI
jgi:hybrid cluster-associated redox disulfide protein